MQQVYSSIYTYTYIYTRVYRTVIDRIALKSITIPPRPFDNEANAVHDLVHEPLHEEDSRQSNDTTVSAAFVLDLACICPLDIHTVGYTRPFHIAVSRSCAYTRVYVCATRPPNGLRVRWTRRAGPFPTDEIIYPYVAEVRLSTN